jgi:hypothetical protein
MTQRELWKILTLCKKMGVSSIKLSKTSTEITLFESAIELPKPKKATQREEQVGNFGLKEEPMPTAEDLLFYSSPFDPKLDQAPRIPDEEAS